MKTSFHLCRALAATIVLFLCGGCASLTTVAYQKSTMAYSPERSPVQIDGSASLDVHTSMAPTLKAYFAKWGLGEEAMANYATAQGEVLADDLVNSGFFARVVPLGGTRPDFLVRLSCEESHPSDFRLRVTIQVLDADTKREVSNHTREEITGSGALSWNTDREKVAMRKVMAALKADLAPDLQEYLAHGRQEAAAALAAANAAVLQNTGLAELIVPTDTTVDQARARNRALVAAKTTQLPGMLRDWKTAELTNLVVKVEQTILDLNHECEVAKDKAQQMTADGVREAANSGRPRAQAAASKLDELRELSIAYRERIELLKPILGAIKEEIANRGR